jgi:hypothetical protein
MVLSRPIVRMIASSCSRLSGALDQGRGGRSNRSEAPTRCLLRSVATSTWVAEPPRRSPLSVSSLRMSGTHARYGHAPPTSPRSNTTTERPSAKDQIGSEPGPRADDHHVEGLHERRPTRQRDEGRSSPIRSAPRLVPGSGRSTAVLDPEGQALAQGAKARGRRSRGWRSSSMMSGFPKKARTDPSRRQQCSPTPG